MSNSKKISDYEIPVYLEMLKSQLSVAVKVAIPKLMIIGAATNTVSTAKLKSEGVE